MRGLRVIVYVKTKNMDTYILIKYLKCAVSQEEEALVREWLANDPDGSHQRQFRQAHDIFNGMTVYSDAPRVRTGRTSRVRRIAFAAMRVAAVAVLIAGVGLWMRNSTLDSISEKTERIYVPAGKSLCMTLEDGTTMWLNAGSEVEYPSVFSRRDRTVRVHSGEVLFDVARDEDRPFFVDSYAAKIAVLGTKFNVKVDSENRKYTAALLRGSIRVSNNSDESETYMLKPDDIVELVDNRLVVSHVDDIESFTCWTAGLINVFGVPFEELMRTYELAFGVDIEIRSERMPEISYSRGKVRVTDGLDHALDMLKLASDFDYVHDYEANKVIIK